MHTVYLACVAALLSAWLAVGTARESRREPARAQSEVPYGVGTWDAERFGNHRAVVRVTQQTDAVRVHLPWRRRDQQPQDKHLVVVSARTGTPVANVARIAITRESGDIAFQPADGPGDYWVYYLPFTGSVRSNYPKITYPPPVDTAGDAWRQRHRLTADAVAGGAWTRLPQAEVVEFQAIDEFNSFYPMEVIATEAETQAVLAAHPDATYLVFPEDRAHPIRMTGDLPHRWVHTGAGRPFVGEAAPGEFYAFQLGIYAARAPISDLSLTFSGLRSRDGRELISPSGLVAFNLGGVDSSGRTFTRQQRVPLGAVQPLWCGMLVPEEARPGEYGGTLTVQPVGQKPTSIRFTLNVSGSPIPEAGDAEPGRLSRLRWLNSRLAEGDDLVRPFTAIVREGLRLAVLGRAVMIDRDGLPARIQSYFAPEMTRLASIPRDVLAAPVKLNVDLAGASRAAWAFSPVQFVKEAPGAVVWSVAGTAGPLNRETTGTLEFDGSLEYRITLTARRRVAIEDVSLEIPVAGSVARYLMGLGVKGGTRPAALEWRWDVKNNQDGAWIGDVNAGLQFSLRDDRYVRPLNTNFYTLKPLVMPLSWYNGGKGGCRLAEDGSDVFLVRCFSGPRTIEPGDPPLAFTVRFLLTPFKPIDPHAQFSTRYFHAYRPVDEVVASGANTINIHHANAINPYINYPFLTPREMKAYVDEAHARGLKVKIYYTVRELTNRAPELFALRSLGDEVLAFGPGGGWSWLQEHVGTNYIAGWFVPALKDAALVTSGVSRWHNFYVEGLAWLVRHIQIDGLYIDDVAFDRLTMKRVRRVLERGRPGALIDLHSANQFNVRDGFANSANLYLEHFPYLDRLWFGEYFDYGAAPDFWMTELAGIPFGLMGEMLQDGGNPWRGMVFGMTARMPRVDVRPLWAVWDAFGLADSRMIGFWVPDSPVKTNHPEVLATCYARQGRVMVALASWAKSPVSIALAIDWAALDLDPGRTTIAAPAIQGFQPELTVMPGDEIRVEPGKGWLLVLAAPASRGSSTPRQVIGYRSSAGHPPARE